MSLDIKAKILEIGSDDGCISIDMLNDLIPEDNDPESIDDIFDFLQDHNIEVLSDEKLAEKSPNDKKDEKEGEPEIAVKQSQSPLNLMSKDESVEVEETTTTYLREMGRFELLTPQEEEKYSKTIREGFDAIIRTIRKHDEKQPEVILLIARIDLWERRDPTLKPKNSILIT